MMHLIGERCCFSPITLCRGHVDNDMILGDVAGFLGKNHLLDKHDVISACCFPQISSFGPFTLYRNIPRITELFRYMDSYYDTINSHKMYICDEWGGGSGRSPGPNYKQSMTKVLTERRHDLNVSIHSWGLPFGYDIGCARRGHSCGYCRWTAGSETSNSRLVASEMNRGLQDAIPGEAEVMFCHFQFGKKQAVSSLVSMSQEMREQFWAASEIEMTHSGGFRQSVSSIESIDVVK